MKKCLILLLGAACLLLSGCSGNSYKLAKDYQTRDTFGFLVFISESGKQYDDLWVNISGLDKTFQASTAQSSTVRSRANATVPNRAHGE